MCLPSDMQVVWKPSEQYHIVFLRCFYCRLPTEMASLPQLEDDCDGYYDERRDNYDGYDDYDRLDDYCYNDYYDRLDDYCYDPDD